MLRHNITYLMGEIARCDDDDAIHRTIARLDTLRRMTSGDDRACVCWAIVECRDLLTASGRHKRAIASIAEQATIIAA